MRRVRAWLMVGLSLLLWARGGLGSGPRYVTGRPFFTTEGRPISWAQSTVLYYTDSGDLSASVNHAAADALVAAAADAWNQPVANVTLSRGGSLGEHVSSANLYLGSSGMVYPADVASTNYASVPIAVIYDTDGSVTEMLLGVGASDPSSCRQNGVTESVDRFDPAGYILHAIIVMNGRCTGAAPQQQFQMQYQLERVFGRVLGVAWSQTNDNVLMGTPTPTYQQALHWPIMHPIEIICGAYTYQCLPQPFTLRADDVASLVMLYPVGSNAAAGKQPSMQNAQGLTGAITFPTGDGMAGVNMLVRRQSQANVQEGWYENSAVSGAMFHTNGTSPFVAQDTSALGSQGTSDPNTMGNYTFPYIPMMTAGDNWQNLVLSMEAVNPLYLGPYSLQPYAAGTVNPSGSAPAPKTAFAYAGGPTPLDMVVSDAATACGTGMDGTLQAPMVTPASGWWNGLLCGVGHASYASLAVQPGRTLTVEVTALDEQGFATMTKAMPVMGVYAPTDGANDLPSVAKVVSAFNALGIGMTRLVVQTGSLSQLRVGIADQRGAGRPDFGYQARVFYADTVTPANVPVAGGTVTIAGMGFRQGNVVKVNGVAASVISAGANAIAVAMPSVSGANAVEGAAVDVVVSDVSTGAVSKIAGGFTYGATAAGTVMKLVSAPAGTVYAGDMAAPAFAVRMTGVDGVTPVAGATVLFSTSVGSATFAACGGTSCSVVTDGGGNAATGVTPTSAGTVTMVATYTPSSGAALTQSASVVALAKDAALNLVSAPEANLVVGKASQRAFAVQAIGADGRGSGGRVITFTVTQGSAIFSRCNAGTCAVAGDWSGTAGLTVTALAAGTIRLLATDGNLTQSVSVQATVLADTLTITKTPQAAVPVNQYSNSLEVLLRHGDGTAYPYQNIVYSAPAGVVFSACGGSTCTVTTGMQGYATTTLMSVRAGTYMIQMSFGGVTQSLPVTFVVLTPTMRLVSAPTGNQVVGQMADRMFTVQMLETDGVTPMTGGLVSFALPSGMGTLVECGVGKPGCTVPLDGNGMAGVTVIPAQAGPITIWANYGSLSQSAAFMAVSTSDLMTVVGTPGASVDEGAASVQPFVVRLVRADGVTPVAGVGVTLSMQGAGAVQFSVCGAASCRVITDGNGLVSSGVKGVSAGSVTLLATADASSGAKSAPVPLQVVASAYRLNATTGTIYIFAGGTFAATVGAAAAISGVAAAGQAVTWSAAGATLPGGNGTVTDGLGATRAQVVYGPLTVGGQGKATACAWVTHCVDFVAVGVAASGLVLNVVSGGAQNVSGGAAASSVVAKVMDIMGNPVGGAPVTISQTVSGIAQTCPARGRCPTAPVLGTKVTVVASDGSGLVSVAPMTVAGTATDTQLVLTAGTQAVAQAEVKSQP